METETPQAPANERRDREIRTLCARVHLEGLAQDMITRDLSIETARAEIIDELARREPPPTNNINLSASGGYANGYDDPSFTREAAAEAITARYTGAALSERARPFA